MDPTPYDKLLDLSNKTAIVTGGAVGIGFGISSRLAEAHANVVIAGITKEESEKAVTDLKSKGFSVAEIQTDVSVEEDVKNMVDETVKLFGSVDILVNNAGIYPNIPVTQMTISDFEKVLAVNLKGVFLCTKYVSERMILKGAGGKIINITSIDALHPSSVGLAHYDASKHGAWGFTKNVALELSQYKIWVNAIAPGGVMTEGVKKMQLTHPATSSVDPNEMIAKFLAKIPMGRMGEPDDIGKVALFLASDMSSYITGTQIIVDGGSLLS
ncbi:MAG: SDR family oxidoreductase [Candidatus Woesebacteria bacterium]|nr:MAG: SDR family oxidoreductase [Candidatus Woesebacteria bacterium]